MGHYTLLSICLLAMDHIFCLFLGVDSILQTISTQLTSIQNHLLAAETNTVLSTSVAEQIERAVEEFKHVKSNSHCKCCTCETPPSRSSALRASVSSYSLRPLFTYANTPSPPSPPLVLQPLCPPPHHIEAGLASLSIYGGGRPEVM